MLHYKFFDHPSSEEIVTFIHGAGGSSAIWFKQLRSFKEKYNVLLIDLRGHGNSKKGFFNKIKSYNFKVVGDDVIEVLDSLKIKSTHFVGISLGTIIIRELAERFPERVKSMILGGAIMKMNVKGQVLMRFGNLFKSVLPYMVLYKFFAFIIMPKRNHKKSRDIFVNEAKKLEQKEFKKWFALVAEVNPLLRFFRLNEIKTPTLYIMGEQDYMFLPSIRKIVEKHASATLEVIPDCGHVVNIEQPSVFNQKVIQFLS
jgi:pimeloyl-ACP methyl ester carboxylesterase